MARAPYEIAGTQVKAGTRQTVEVPVAKLYTHTPLHIPVEVVHGRRSGPVLMVCGAIHDLVVVILPVVGVEVPVTVLVVVLREFW